MADRSRVVMAGSRVRLGLASDEWLVACVRRGDTAAFEALYDRHVRELLGFCMYMLGSRHDAEDAVQATFASAYRALRADSRPVALRPWLFTIARNDCLSILRRRRPVVELNGEIAAGTDPVDQIELREEVRRVFEGLRELPESQRAALVLAEVHGLSHGEVGEVLGVRADQVKAFVYQARSKLVSERAARDTDCREIREELAGARGAALLRGRLRRHMRACPDCRTYADGVARQRRQLGALLPLVPPLALKYRAIEEALNISASDPVAMAGGATVGATAAGTAAELAGGGVKALVCKVAAGMACLGASAGVGVSVLSTPEPSVGQGSSAASAASAPLIADAQRPGALTSASTVLVPAGSTSAGGKTRRSRRRGGRSTAGGGAGEKTPGAPSGGTDGTLPGGGGGGGAGNGGSGGAAPETHGSGAAEGHGGGGGLSSAGERRASAEQRQTKRSGHRQLSEERARAREEKKAASPPPKSEEQIQREHEEAARRREEHKPEGHSKAPPTEEQLRLKRERAEKRKAEKRKQKEAQEQKAKEEEERAAEGEGAPAPTP
jgi:RNA polymerase sigma factor (sigma-70 family)